MKRVHYTDSYLMSPQHPVTVNLIGAGGTGSQVLTCLARLDTALRGLGHPGLFVTLYDPDTDRDGSQHRSPAFRTVRPGTEQGTMPRHPDKQLFRE